MSKPGPDDVLRFWFGDADDEATVLKECSARWWKKDPDFDAEIEARFGDRVREAAAGGLESWTETPHGTLALIILLDQFTRNTRRGTGAMYEGDERALALAEDLVASGDWRALRCVERSFALMPLMHAEDVSVQDRCVTLFGALADDAPEGKVADMMRTYCDYAVQHRDIVARFGRFPHRNALLGRDSTPEEEAFLEGPGSKF